MSDSKSVWSSIHWFWHQSRVQDSLVYWERRRFLYNIVLALLTLAFWGGELIQAPLQEKLLALVVLLVFAGCANLLYCAAYPVDLLFLFSRWEEIWRRRLRGVLFAMGTALAVGATLYVLIGPRLA